MDFLFTIHNDPGDFSDTHGLYLMLGSSTISETLFYFGLQTDVQGLDLLGTGKGVIYSRWDTRDLSNARVPPDCFATSSGGEGDFIGLRCPYKWTAGEYSARIGLESTEDVGEWYGLWVTEESSGVVTWMGSLRFPKSARHRRGVDPAIATVVEIYGHHAIKPIDIPEWHISMAPPIEDRDSPADYLATSYENYDGTYGFFSADMWYSKSEGHLHFLTGGATEREHEEIEIFSADIE